MPDINLEAASNAVVYINRDGKIVYANLNFIRMMGHDRDVPMLGRFIHDALGVDAAETVSMRSEPAQATPAILLELHPGDGSIPLRCLGEPAYDRDKTFIGWNLSFQAESPRPAPPPEVPAPADNSAQLALDYTLQQVTAIQTLLARLIGFGVRDRLENNLNALAKEQGWPLTMANGEFTLNTASVDAALCEPLLSAAVNYGVQITGWQKINGEMLRVEEKMNPDMLAAADKLGLRNLIPSQ